MHPAVRATHPETGHGAITSTIVFGGAREEPYAIFLSAIQRPSPRRCAATRRAHSRGLRDAAVEQAGAPVVNLNCRPALRNGIRQYHHIGKEFDRSRSLVSQGKLGRIAC